MMLRRTHRALLARSTCRHVVQNTWNIQHKCNTTIHRSALGTSDITRKSYSNTSLSSPSIVAFADGACRGNPGAGACGALIIDRTSQTLLASRSRYLSDQETNNTAEYHALLLALELAEELQLTELQICMDSELIIKQMRGQYRVKAPHLRVLYEASKTRCKAFDRVQFDHVPREQNAHADRLANDALDQESAQNHEEKQNI